MIAHPDLAALDRLKTRIQGLRSTRNFRRIANADDRSGAYRGYHLYYNGGY